MPFTKSMPPQINLMLSTSAFSYESSRNVACLFVLQPSQISLIVSVITIETICVHWDGIRDGRWGTR